MENIKDIIVVGGGSAGLVSALMIKQTFPNINLSIIYSNNIGIIGVGEGTTPNWNEFIEYCDIDTIEFFLRTDATFKFGIEFLNWDGNNNSYLHSGVWMNRWFGYNNFYEIHKNYPYMFAHIIADNRSTYETTHPFISKNLIPKDKLLDGPIHFNTYKTNDYLKELCSRRSIKLIETDIVSVSTTDNGISSITDVNNITYNADFFIDCSGFARLLSKNLNSKWIDYKKYLPMNHAIAFPTEQKNYISNITKSTALSSGWCWQIPTYGRNGNGYVFNDSYITADDAKKEIENFYGHEIDIGKDIKFSAGKIDKFWNKNCVSIGLSGSFVEPLEASSIGFTIKQIFYLIDNIVYWRNNSKFVENNFNTIFNKSFDNIVDYVQLHYFTKRKDTPFWKELEFVTTDFNKETIEIFKTNLPRPTLFDNNNFLFLAHDWIQVMHGLDMFDKEKIGNELSSFNFNYNNLNEIRLNHLNSDRNLPKITHKQYLDELHITNGENIKILYQKSLDEWNKINQ